MRYLPPGFTHRGREVRRGYIVTVVNMLVITIVIVVITLIVIIVTIIIIIIIVIIVIIVIVIPGFRHRAREVRRGVILRSDARDNIIHHMGGLTTISPTTNSNKP